MNILIAGDSWGCGEWDKDCNYNPHQGLEQYLLEDGYNVVANLSQQGLSNHDIYQRLEHYFKRHSTISVDTVFVFQTEYNRDNKHSPGWETALAANDWDNLQEPEDISSRWLSRFYQNLSSLAQENKCTVYIIGGHSDTIWFDDMNLCYPGCNLACQSMTNLILNNNHRIDNPVFSFYERKTEQLVEQIKSKLDTPEKISRLIDLMDAGYKREMLLRENPMYFYPDGIHPNRLAIRILYDFLKAQQIL